MILYNAVQQSDPTLFELLRHGESEGGLVLRGHQDDPLTAHGWQQMEQAVGPADRWDAILSSPLQRCHAFARDLAERLQVPLFQDGDLADIQYGEWQGLTLDEVGRRDRRRLWAFWEGQSDYPPPGGESLQDVQDRVGRAWGFWSERLQGQRVLMIGHGSVIRMILSSILGMPPSRAFASLKVPHGSRTLIQLQHTDHGVFPSLLFHGLLPPRRTRTAAEAA